MVKRDYKETILKNGSTYYAWYAMFVAKDKSEKQ